MTKFIAKGAMMRVADFNQQFGPLRLQQLGEDREFLAVQIQRLMRRRVHKDLAARKARLRSRLCLPARRVADAVELFIDLLQFEFNQFAPDDSALGGPSETRIAPTFPFGIETFQTGYCLSQPLSGRLDALNLGLRAAGIRPFHSRMSFIG
jgi:hypothetical protein